MKTDLSKRPTNARYHASSHFATPPQRPPLAWHVEKRRAYIKKDLSKIPLCMKRDLQKRPTYTQKKTYTRDLFQCDMLTLWKKTYAYEKKPTKESYYMYMKKDLQNNTNTRDVLTRNHTSSPLLSAFLLHDTLRNTQETRWRIWKETYVYEKRPTKETYKITPTQETCWRAITFHHTSSPLLSAFLLRDTLKSAWRTLKRDVHLWKEIYKRDIENKTKRRADALLHFITPHHPFSAPFCCATP